MCNELNFKVGDGVRTSTNDTPFRKVYKPHLTAKNF